MASPTTFHQFPRLPHEVQSHIWSLASISHPEYFQDATIDASFLYDISNRQLYHYEPIDVLPSFHRHIPQSLPSLYCCMYGQLQFMDGYQDTWNLLGTCVESRRSVLRSLKSAMCEIKAPKEDSKDKRWINFAPATFEEVRGCLVREIGEVIEWLDEKESKGLVFSDLIYRINWNVPYIVWVAKTVGMVESSTGPTV